MLLSDKVTDRFRSQARVFQKKGPERPDTAPALPPRSSPWRARRPGLERGRPGGPGVSVSRWEGATTRDPAHVPVCPCETMPASSVAPGAACGPAPECRLKTRVRKSHRLKGKVPVCQATIVLVCPSGGEGTPAAWSAGRDRHLCWSEDALSLPQGQFGPQGMSTASPPALSTWDPPFLAYLGAFFQEDMR